MQPVTAGCLQKREIPTAVPAAILQSVSQSAADKSGTQQAAVQTESVKETSAPVSTGTEYILNTNTKKFHYPSCSSVKQMKASNKKEYTGSRDDLIAQGYDPCKKCNP